MHAVERYDGVVEKLKESADELERSKEGARHIAEQFEDVKNRRRRLFQVSHCIDHQPESDIRLSLSFSLSACMHASLCVCVCTCLILSVYHAGMLRPRF